MNHQGAQENGHDNVGGNAHGHEGDKGSSGAGIVGRLRPCDPFNGPFSELFRML